MQLPCDACIWGLIPMIKRELVLELSVKHKISKVGIARKLGISKGSVTQYIQGKRAANSGKVRKIYSLNKKIEELAETIKKKNLSNKELAAKFCSICKEAQKRSGLS